MVGLGAALVVTVAAASPNAPAPVGPRRPPAGAAGPTRHTGPQGTVGQFVVRCDFSHSGRADPIVFPGEPGRSHRHDFYGAVTTRADTSARDLLGAPTTCDKEADTAAYWHPSLFDHGRAVRPRAVEAYYRPAPGVDGEDVVPFPLGMALIAGDPGVGTAGSGGAAGWSCGTSTRLDAEPPECPATAPLTLVLTFQDCWDGRHLDSVDHRSHAAYSAGGRCPRTHRVHLPQLTMAVTFPVSGRGHRLRLSSGSVHTAHGDFLNGWDPAGLAREVQHCLHRGAVCELASNRGEEPLFQHR